MSEGRVIVQTGSVNGSLLALTADTGEEVWRGGSAEAGYASPYLRKTNPKEIVVFNQDGLSIHDQMTGQEKFLTNTGLGTTNAAQPWTSVVKY